MSVYQFLPAHNLLTVPTNYVWHEDIFSSEELDRIEKIGDQLETVDGTAANKENDRSLDFNVRKCKISWMARNPDTQFIYDKIAGVTIRTNAKHYDFDLFGFVERFQYTIYDESESHYDWHLDMHSSPSIPFRKLSLVMQLSDPKDYEGGNLELFTSANPTVLEKKRGLIHIFPSYFLHRVTPVTKGVRKTLVAWVTGNRFK